MPSVSLITLHEEEGRPHHGGQRKKLLYCCCNGLAALLCKKEVILIYVLKYNNVEFTPVKVLLVLSVMCIEKHGFLCSSNPVGGRVKGAVTKW